MCYFLLMCMTTMAGGYNTACLPHLVLWDSQHTMLCALYGQSNIATKLFCAVAMWLQVGGWH